MPRKIVRLLCDTQNTSPTIRDTITSERPFWWAGSDLAIQLALSNRGQFLTSAQVSVLIVEVKRLNAAPTEATLMRKVYGPADCDSSFAGADWPGGVKQLVTATFTAAEAALDPGVYRLIVRTEDGSGLKNTYLSSEITVVEDHSESTSITAPPTPPTEYWTKPEADARYALKQGDSVIANDHRVNWFLKQVLDYANAMPIDREGKYIGVCSVGDSIATNYEEYIGQELEKRFGIGAYVSSTFNGRYGFQFSNGNPTNNQADLAGGTARVSGDFRYLGNGEYWNLPVGGTVTETQTQQRHRCGFRRMVFFYGKQAAGGTLTFQVQQGGVVTATKSVSTAGTAGTLGYVEILPADGLLDNRVPTIVVTGSVAAAHYIGGYVFLREGLVPAKMAFPGSSIAQGAGIPVANIATYLQQVGVSLIWHAFKEQTPSSPSSLSGQDMIDHFNKFGTNFPNYCHLLIGQTPSDLTPSGSDQSLTAVMRQCAKDHSFAFIDAFAMMGSFAEVTALNWIGGDTVHLAPQVYQVIASKIFAAMFNGFEMTGGLFLNRNRREIDRRFIQDTARDLPFSPYHIHDQTASSNFVFRQGDPADDSNRDLCKSWWWNGGASPTVNTQAGVILARRVDLFGRNLFRASWCANFRQIDAGITLQMLFGQQDILGTGLSKQGVAVEMGFETVGSDVQHWVRMFHHDGTNLYTSSKFYLEKASANAGLWAYGNNSLDVRGDYVLEFDGNQGSTKKRMTLFFRAPILYTGQPGAVQPFKIADWTFTVSNGSSIANSEPYAVARVVVGAAPVTTAYSEIALLRVTIDAPGELSDPSAVPW